MRGITISYLQEYIKSNDYNPELKERYFMKLVEEVGELSRAMYKNLRPENEAEIKGTLDEEIWDVIDILGNLIKFSFNGKIVVG
ncbi:MAG: hypothetical protein FWH02_04375 [Oscillospiraceae bacterium]|nr:hypothetical protein [Oscillospiraceae bacterium]